MGAVRDETAKMAAMDRWLDAVCDELGVDRSVVHANRTALLNLIRHVAHGPSRPGAPMTAFIVGLASGAAGADARAQTEAVAERISAVEALVASWSS